MNFNDHLSGVRILTYIEMNSNDFYLNITSLPRTHLIGIPFRVKECKYNKLKKMLFKSVKKRHAVKQTIWLV